MRRPSITARITAWYVTIFAVIVGVWAVSLVLLVRADLYAGIDRALASRASQIALGLGTPGEGVFQDISDSTLAGLPREQTAAQLLTANGRIIEYAGGALSQQSLAPADVVSRAAKSSGALLTTIHRGEDRYRLLVVRDDKQGHLILVGANTESADDAVARVIAILLLTGPLVLLAAGGGGRFVARRALSPVAHMTAIAAGIGIDRLSERVPLSGGQDELDALAETLNHMLARLENGVQEKRRLVADASHELQTPLAVMRAEVDVTLASPGLAPEAVEVLESAREEIDRMIRIVRNLLTLARFDEGTLQLLRRPVDLLEMAEETVESLSVLAKERGVSLTATGERALVDADAEYLRLVVVNLAENAVKYSGRGASVSVEVESGGGKVTLSVTDTGPGIPLEAQPLVFDRFYRIDSSRSKDSGGSGLGLAISKEITEAHGGRIELESEPGAGSRFTVVLPAQVSRT